VILADVGLSAFYGSRTACLVIDGENLVAIHRGVPLPIPASPSATLEYLKRAAALDPAPSPLLAAIEALTSSGAVAMSGTPDEEPASRRD
jgi:hypothetical protein